MMCGVDDWVLASLMAEVDSPVLQRTVLRLASEAAAADKHLAESEAAVMAAARKHWRLCAEGVAGVASQRAAQPA